MTIQVNLKVRKGDFDLHAEFQVPGTGVTAVFGRSGCGKSTLLRAIAGLEEPLHGGLVSVNGVTWCAQDHSVPVHQRRVGYVFQEPGLFPHLSVQGNLEFALKRRRLGEGAADLDEVVPLLGLEHLLLRRPATLSGGEKQRVAIGRALLSAPALLLMDEPLAALDARSKDEILPFIDRLCSTARMPVLYVSHSTDEVARLADQLIFMEQGRVLAHGPLAEVLARVDSPIARSDEAFSVLHCGIAELEGPCHLSILRTASCDSIYVPRLPLGEQRTLIRLRINARDVSLCSQRPVGSSILNILRARVTQVSDADGKGQQLVQLRLADSEEILLARISEYSCRQLEITEGMEMFCQIKAVALLS